MADSPVSRRSEKEGIFRFVREMISALAMALVAIFYVIQAFKIPSGSMEDSLLVGDFLLGLKFIYGAPIVPFTYKKLPAVAKPKSGDVIIFEYPGLDEKDYIKRCVAVSGQTVEIHGRQVFIDGKETRLPPRGKYISDGRLGYPGITDFAPLKIPSKGDTITVDSLPIREFLFLKNLVCQENPDSRFQRTLRSLPIIGGAFGGGRPHMNSHVRVALQLYLDGEYANSRTFTVPNYAGEQVEFSFNRINDGQLNLIDNWTHWDMIGADIKKAVEGAFPGKKVDIRRVLTLDDKIVKKYVVKNTNYFMMGDNRDNSMDSRYWGYVNNNNIKAKAFILYFSLDKDVPFYMLPMKIRWNRIGKLIRSWDLLPTPGRV